MSNGALFTQRKLGARPTWQSVYRRYESDRECLAAHLALESAEVLGGVKPSNLVKLTGRRRPCGRSLYELWKRHGKEVVDGSGLRVRQLADRGDSVLLLLYEPEFLGRLLARRRVGIILGRAGYPAPSDPDEVLDELARRLGGDGFPHEIGVFLGYPLKDVLGFLGWVRIPFTCQGPWRIYGEAAESLMLAELHLECRCRVAGELSSGGNPLECFRIRNTGRECRAVSNDIFGK